MTPPDSDEYLRARTIRNVENPMTPPDSDAAMRKRYAPYCCADAKAGGPDHSMDCQHLDAAVAETGRAVTSDDGAAALLGSSVLPTMISVGTQMVQLGDVVRRAFRASGFSEEQWNSQPTIEREGRLARTVFDMRGVRVEPIAILPLSLAQRILAALEWAGSSHDASAAICRALAAELRERMPK